MPVRLMNMEQNPFVGMIPHPWQKAIFVHGDPQPVGLEGGTPIWVFADFSVPAQQTQDARLPLPNRFVLFSAMASSDQAASFRMQLYDVNRKRRLIERPVNAGNYAGNGASPAFASVPYAFVNLDAQCMVRAVNLATVTAVIQVILHGVQMKGSS